MQRLLNPSEAARIRERLHDNGLLQTCQRVWPDRQAIITSFAACAEDIFCEVAWLVDELIETDRDSDAISLTKGLWTTVTNHISSWAGQVSLTDRYLAVSTVFRIVATAFSLHWESYYSDRLREALLDVENEKMPAPKDLYYLRQGQRQQEELLMSIASCSELLSEWVNEYIDNPNLWLTEEIDMALNPQPNIKPPKPESRKADKKPFAPDTYRDTFTYWPDGMSKEERDIRLKLAFSRMRGTLIHRDTHYDTFEALLNGKPLDVKIVWIGTNSQLRGLFNQLVTKNKLVKKPTGGLNQILTARFKKENGTPFTSNEIKNAGSTGDMSVVNDVVSYLAPASATTEDLEIQLSRILTEEQERADMMGKKDGKYQRYSPKGTNVSATPNQHTRTTKRKKQ